MSNIPFTVKSRKIALLTAMLFSFSVLRAQVTDTLKEVNVTDKRKMVSNDERLNSFSAGQRIKTIDSLTLVQYQYQSVANLLAQQVPVFVKSYGFNNIATLNFRGASAAQSQVYWNGVPVNNASTGITDVSLLRTSMYSKVNLVYGGSSALWGSGNVGGALMLENEIPYFSHILSSKVNASVAAGSFGQYQGALGYKGSRKKWFAAVNANAQIARNDFKYSDNNIEYKTVNSSLQSLSGQIQLAYKLNDRNTLNYVAFGQYFHREIPKALFESTSVKKQEDATMRLLLDWKRRGDKLDIAAKLSYSQDVMQYKDSMAAVDARYDSRQVYSDVSAKYKLGIHHRFLLFLPVHLSWMIREAQGDVVSQLRVGLAGAYNFSTYHNRLNIALHGRLRLNNDKSLPVTGLGINYQCTQWLSIRTNVQRSYRLPTLAEMYYVPGGNSSLKPEQGWSSDIGYAIKTKQEHKLVFSHDVSLFNRRIKDWILWFGGAIWTPHNIAEVHSRGIETENMLQYKMQDWKFHIGLNTAYILATTEQSYIVNDGSIGKQIPYSPRYNGQANAGFSYRHFYVNYNQTYTGVRFITVDESAWMAPYTTGNVQLMYTAPLSGRVLQISLQLNNIWSEQYMVVNGRPMPGLNFMAGLNLLL